MLIVILSITPSIGGLVIGQPPKSLQTVYIVFCYSNLEQGLSGDCKTRYSRKLGHGHPDEGLPGTWDK